MMHERQDDMEVYDIDEIKGKTFERVFQSDPKGDDMLTFANAAGQFVTFYHSQDCCESVYIDDVCGDLSDLEGVPVLEATVSCKDDPEASESGTWTFYRFRTIKGTVTVRWIGQSNGYYSESVDVYSSSTKDRDPWGLDTDLMSKQVNAKLEAGGVQS